MATDIRTCEERAGSANMFHSPRMITWYGNSLRRRKSGRLRQSYETLCVAYAQPRWVPHERNCADCLTKRKANGAPLLEMLRAGSELIIEEDELKRRKEERERTGKKNPRPNRMSEETGKSTGKRKGSHPRQSSAKPKQVPFNYWVNEPGPMKDGAPSREEEESPEEE